MEWAMTLLAAETIGNRIPQLKKTRPLRLMRLNPFGTGPAKATRGIPLKGDQGEKLLDRMVDRFNGR